MHYVLAGVALTLLFTALLLAAVRTETPGRATRAGFPAAGLAAVFAAAATAAVGGWVSPSDLVNQALSELLAPVALLMAVDRHRR
jgi:hypothetical protein